MGRRLILLDYKQDSGGARTFQDTHTHTHIQIRAPPKLTKTDFSQPFSKQFRQVESVRLPHILPPLPPPGHRKAALSKHLYFSEMCIKQVVMHFEECSDFTRAMDGLQRQLAMIERTATSVRKPRFGLLFRLWLAYGDVFQIRQDLNKQEAGWFAAQLSAPALEVLFVPFSTSHGEVSISRPA